MANEPQILGSDVDVLDAIAADRCDVGLTNHYYLGRMLEEDPDVPDRARLGRPGRRGRAHEPLRRRARARLRAPCRTAIRLMEFLTAREAQALIVENSEFAANPDVPPAEHIRELGGRRDRSDRRRAGWAEPRGEPSR